MTRKRLGEVLLERGELDSCQIQTLLDEQRRTTARFGELILERGWVSKKSVADALETASRMKYIDCVNQPSEKKALECVPHEVAARLVVLPVRIERSQIVMAMAEPQTVSAVDELRFLTGRDISPRLSFRPEIIPAIEQNYGGADYASAALPVSKENEAAAAPAAPESADDMEFVSISSRQGNREAFQEIAAELMHKKSPAVRMISAILAEAINRHASDILIEPRLGETMVLVRVKGLVSELDSIPGNLQNALISRIKTLSDMDVSERSVPQDGGLIVKLGDRCIQARVSTAFNPYGEKVLMRLLNFSEAAGDSQQRGVAHKLAEQVLQLLKGPQGMLLVTGPTGPGKSPSLYSMLHMLRKPVRNAQLWRSARHVAFLLHYFSESTI